MAKQGYSLGLIVILLLLSVLGLSLFFSGKLDDLLSGGTIDLDLDGDSTGDALDVNRKVEITFVDKFGHALPAGASCYVYKADGKTLSEGAALTVSSTGVATTGKYYESGTVLVIEYENTTTTTERLRKHITVPQMKPADIEAVTVNPITIDIFTSASAITATCQTDAGTSVQDANTTTYSCNKTVEGNTGSITFNWYVPTDNTGQLTSYDEIDGLNWYVVLYGKLSGTNYEYVDLTGWDGQYTKGTSVWYYKVLDPTAVTKYKVGNTYIYNGAGGFTFSFDLSGYSGDAANCALWMKAYSDPGYHDVHGSFGPDNYQIDNYSTTGFQIYFTD